MAKPAGRLRISGDGRHKKQYRRQPYDYDFKLRVINYYATAGISTTTTRFFTSTDDIPSRSKPKLVSKWKQQRALTAATTGHQRRRDRALATTLPQSAEASIVKWVNDFRRGGVPVSSTTLKICASEEADRLEIPLGVFSATCKGPVPNSSQTRHARLCLEEAFS